MHGGLGICRGFPAVSVTDSQRLVSPERVPSLVVTGMAAVDQVVRAPGVSSLILVTDGSGGVTFIDGRHRQSAGITDDRAKLDVQTPNSVLSHKTYPVTSCARQHRT